MDVAAPASPPTTDRRVDPGPAGAALPGPVPSAVAVVTRWALTAPAGRSLEELAAAVSRGACLAGPADQDVLGPWDRAALVAGFDKKAELGRKGTRTLDRAAALAVATVGRLGIGGDDVGLVLGTGMGSVQSTMDFTRDALTGERPYLVDPARFPNTVMNFAAGQCAIWHRLCGPNATVTAGRATGLAAVRYAARWLRLGHAARVVVAAAEEMTPQRGRIERAITADPSVPLGEGCAALLLCPPGDRAGRSDDGQAGQVVAEVLAVSTALAAVPARVAPALRGCLEDVLAVLPDGVAPDLHAPFDARDGSAERQAVAAVRPGVPGLDVTGVLGDTGAVAGLFQLQASVATLSPAGGHALVTSVDAEGVLGAMLLRVPAPEGGR